MRKIHCIGIIIMIIQLTVIQVNAQDTIAIFQSRILDGQYSKLDYVSKHSYFIDSALFSTVNISYNSWQIYDSTVYMKNNLYPNTKVYIPIYEDRSIVSYNIEISHENTNLQEYKTPILNSLRCDFNLDAEYLQYLDHLISNASSFQNGIYFFDNEGISTLFYNSIGLGYNDYLQSLYIESSNDLLLMDSCVYNNYYVVSKYYYKKRFLDKIETSKYEKRSQKLVSKQITINIIIN